VATYEGLYSGGECGAAFVDTNIVTAGTWSTSWIIALAGSEPSIGAGATTTAADHVLGQLIPGATLANIYAGFYDMQLACDRLGHFMLDGTLSTNQTVTFTPAARYGDDIGNVMFVEMATSSAGSARTLIVTYTNQSGTSGRTGSVTIPASSPRGSAFFIPLQSGDTGVQSIQSAQLSASLGGATKALLTIARPLHTSTAFDDRETVYALLPTALSDFVAVGGENTAICLYRMRLASSTNLFQSGSRGISVASVE
jgi:hypothetical protein